MGGHGTGGPRDVATLAASLFASHGAVRLPERAPEYVGDTAAALCGDRLPPGAARRLRATHGEALPDAWARTVATLAGLAPAELAEAAAHAEAGMPYRTTPPSTVVAAAIAIDSSRIGSGEGHRFASSAVSALSDVLPGLLAHVPEADGPDEGYVPSP